MGSVDTESEKELEVMTKSIKTLAAVLLAAALFAPARVYAAVAPLNPAYVEYMRGAEQAKNGARSLAADGSAEERASGYVPSPLNWSHLAGRTWSLPREKEAARGTETPSARAAANDVSEALPARYDLREEMPPVRDQTYFNNCWTYSAMAATESNLITKRLAGTDIDLSEWYLTYYALNPWKDMACFTNSSGAPYYDIGGNDWKSVALLSRGTGSVTTAKAPDISSAGGDFSAVYAPAPAARDYKLTGAYYLGDNAVFEVRLSAERRDMIKRAIMEYGAVSVGINMGASYNCYNRQTAAYYSGLSYDPSWVNGVPTDHAVTIVGWDDGYSKDNFISDNRPANDGAWIVRNSWGEIFGDGGYFYVSYEEGTLCDGVAYETEEARGGENVYQYDDLGCIGWYTLDTLFPSVGGAKDVQYFANIFTAESSDAINAVAFYAADERISYEISVYTDCAGDLPVSGRLAWTGTADSLVPGYNTVTLGEPAEVAAGTRFSVVVRAVSPGGDCTYATIPTEYEIKGYSDGASANPGEGWFSVDGENFYDAMEVGESEGYDNLSVCLKAFGERIYTASDAPVSVTGGVTAGGSVSEASASNISGDENSTAQDGVLAALRAEAVSGVAADKNVALLGAFRLNAEHSGGSARFSVELAEPMSFEGAPYVIIQNHRTNAYCAFAAEYSGSSLSFSVDALDDYFSSATVVVADVRESSASQSRSSGSGGGCSAGVGAFALLAAVPLLLRRVKR
ncbi:lectin like domain-containing protein [Cloacibacillus sp. An23]|uniref:lectin like domain-containing protein n=1 Tax=Cloacibacillus sp. An23 TaxID=1965591 RepID=UPI000B3A311D|nr:lectin like domain-containing protein [Cloacibacillus sp. An23]OUO94399.1 hypothetical protein B5F39_04015 [Cloacibacillus sp. An23]